MACSVFRAIVMMAVAVLLFGGAARAATGDSLDAAARDYVLLSLTIGEKEPGYIDAYYGPPELKARALKDAPGLDAAALQARAEALRTRVRALAPRDQAAMAARRGRFLEAQLTAAITRLRMMRGEKLAFVDEAQGLFAVRPHLEPLASFDPVLAKIERLVPGPGPLAARIEAFNDRFNVPPDRVQPVVAAAITECRARTLAHIALPVDERFDLSLVKDKPWGGYNYYLGKDHSRIEINTDLPLRLSRAIDLGCHEGYPGHHVYNVLLEQQLVRGRGWIEFTVYPLYSPQSLIAEGSANYGIGLAFPGDAQLAFARAVLAPLAGLPTAEVGRYEALRVALDALKLARITIAQLWLDGKIDDAEAVRLAGKYQLISAERARKSLDFTRTYRSYVINYGLGEDLIRAAVEAAGADPMARWARMRQILSEPTLPADLR